MAPLTRTRRATVAVGVALTVLVATAATAGAVSAVTLTTLTDSEVESGATTTHTLSFRADGISADGNADVVYIQLPDTYAGNVSFSDARFRNRTSGATVPISSSTSIVDGPDGDGVQDTVRTGISHDADYATDEINATYQFSLTHPAVAETTTYDVRIVVDDSATPTAETTVADAITVLGSGDAATATSTATPTATSTPTATPTDVRTAGSGGSGGGGTATPGGGTTDGGGPGFSAAVAVVAVLGAAALAVRRRA